MVKVLSEHPEFDLRRETKPIIGNMYQYHLFPMLFIFVLISFVALFDDMTFKLFGEKKEKSFPPWMCEPHQCCSCRIFCMVCK